jgi:hypothetical protein
MEKPKPQPAPHPVPKKADKPTVYPVEESHHEHKHPVQPYPAHPYPAHPQPVSKKVTKSLCESHMHRYVEVQAADGYCYDGIVEHVDDEWLCLAVPGSADQMRGFFPGPPFGPFYPYRPRRFNRLVLPLAGLAAIALLPYYW